MTVLMKKISDVILNDNITNLITSITKFTNYVDEKIISDVILNENITTLITSKTKVTKNSKDAITYYMSLFEDYVSMSSCKFIFLTIRCYCNFYIVFYQQCSAMIFILFVVITLYQRYDVDISYINNILC